MRRAISQMLLARPPRVRRMAAIRVALVARLIDAPPTTPARRRAIPASSAVAGRRSCAAPGRPPPSRRSTSAIELRVRDLLEGAHQRAVVGDSAPRGSRRSRRCCRDFEQLLDQLHAELVVRRPVVAVGEVERIDVPVLGLVARLDDLERQLVGGRDLRAAALAVVKNSSSVTSFASVWWADEDDLDVVVLRAQEAHHPEVEAARDVLLELAHDAGDVHHGHHDGVATGARWSAPRS